MASGDPISANTKHVSSVQVPNWVTPGMFAGNAMMNFKDPDGAVERRAGVFPFPRRIRPGEGIVDLVQRIITEESAALLIKINSVYLAMRRTIRQPIAPLLPPEVRLATHQAIIENDPLRSFIAQHCVTSGRNDHRIFWVDFVDAYQAWCKASGFAFRSASSGGGGGGGGGLNPYSQEMLTLFHRLNVRLSDNHNNDPLALIGMRPRVAGDPPYQSVFAVQPQDEEEDNSVDCCDNNNNNSSSSNEEDDEDDPDMDNFSMSD